MNEEVIISDKNVMFHFFENNHELIILTRSGFSISIMKMIPVSLIKNLIGFGSEKR